jgi:hypothetical protein
VTNLVASINETDVLNGDVKYFLENSPEYQELEKNIASALEESSEVVVVTASDVATAANFVSNFKKISKEAESVRKRLVQPLVDKKSDIDSFFKGIPAKYQDELNRLEKEILDFQRKEREEANRKAAEERRRLEEEALHNAIQKGLDEPAVIPEVIPEIKKVSAMNTSKVTTRKTKSFKIINESLIPRGYLIVDERKIRAERMKFDACNQDGTNVKSTIPGVVFTFEESVV